MGNQLYERGWEVIIGMEIHAQVISNSKLFSGASTAFGADPNANVSFVDVAFPGMLPVLNEYCVDQAIKTGLGLNAKINTYSEFARKNYFYPDLPAGYQISQFKYPIVSDGYIDIETEGKTKKIRIERLHLEQDAGKCIHDQSPTKTYIDLNRCGIALMEIVTYPDMRSVEEATTFIKKLHAILRYLKTCDGNMENGSMRADINVSVRKPGQELGTRTETKNVNSIKFLAQAIKYEAERQISVIESGQKIIQETRLFDASTGTTRSMRGKESAQDYRYFPDPDLPALVLSDDRIEKILNTLPELPDAKSARLLNNYGLSHYDVEVIVSEPEYAVFYENCVEYIKHRKDYKELAKMVSNWMIVELFAHMNKNNVNIINIPVSSKQLVDLVLLIKEEVISGKIAKQVFEIMWSSKKDPGKIVEEQGLKQIVDTSKIEETIKQVLNNEKNKVQEYKSGKEKLFGYFVGQIMKATQGKANPNAVNDLLRKILNDL